MNKNNKDQIKNDESKIISREKKMVDSMVLIYCKNHHNSIRIPCKSCTNFSEYSKNRLENCFYQDKKPVCGRCGLSCYNSHFKKFGETCFNYAGPRILFHDPKLALHHIIDSFRNNDQLKNINKKTEWFKVIIWSALPEYYIKSSE